MRKNRKSSKRSGSRKSPRSAHTIGGKSRRNKSTYTAGTRV